MVDSVYWIWLQNLFGVGSNRADLFMRLFPSAQELYESVKAKGRAASMLSAREVAESDKSFALAQTIKSRTLNKGCEIITPDHPLYPPALAEIYSKPAALYVRGDLSCLQDTLAIAMVGTRDFSKYGRAAATQLAAELAQSGVVIVSGLAMGIDSFCHSAALEAGGKTVGVMGCGLDINYPKDNAKLKSAMRRSGAVVAELPLGVEPRPFHFPTRNRIISGMCRGVVVVEADRASGAIITAGLALEQGRDVFAVPGGIFDSGSQGPHGLIRDGAKIVESAEDILCEYGIQINKKEWPLLHNPLGNMPTIKEEPARAAPRELPAGLSEEALLVYEKMDKEPALVDELLVRSGMEVSQLHLALTELEIYGLAESRPGRLFARIYHV